MVFCRTTQIAIRTTKRPTAKYANDAKDMETETASARAETPGRGEECRVGSQPTRSLGPRRESTFVRFLPTLIVLEGSAPKPSAFGALGQWHGRQGPWTWRITLVS